MEKIVNRDYFRISANDLAIKLLGNYLCREISGKLIKTKIVETEAYMGEFDKASHASTKNKTERNSILYMDGGHVYIYLIYGKYYCFNIVANRKRKPESVFIRAVEPVEGIETIKKNRKNIHKEIELTNGPGKLSMALGLDKEFNKKDITKNKYLWLEKNSNKNFKIKKDKRINIDYAEEFKNKKWRFYILNNKYVSH